jgi:hypothetical protein
MLLRNVNVGWHYSLVKLLIFFGFQKKIQANEQNLLQILHISKKFDRLFLSNILPKKHNLFSFLSGVPRDGLSVWPC